MKGISNEHSLNRDPRSSLSAQLVITEGRAQDTLKLGEDRSVQIGEYMKELLKSLVLAYANHGLGLATLLNDDGVCLQYMKKAVFHAEKSGLIDYCKQLERNDVPFLRNVHGERFDLEEVVPEECVHQHIVRGENEKALQMIKELEEEGKDSDFLTYYKGKATQDKNVLGRALERFERENKAHLLPLVKREIGIPV